MFSHKADPPTAVHVPVPADDKPSWVKVGVIAAIGFAVGIAWPRLAGVRLGPSAPEVSSAAAARAEASAAPAMASAPIASSAPVPVASAPPASAAAPKVTVSHGWVKSCKADDGKPVQASACGALSGFDPVAQPRLKKLEQCTAAEGISGKLAVVFNVDFPANRIEIDVDKQTTIAQPEPLVGCLRAALQGVSIAKIDHEQPRYSVMYTATLVAPQGAAPQASASATGSAKPGEESPGQITSEVARVREAPNGKIVARLPRGTKVTMVGGASKEGWFKIKYGADMASEGFVYRNVLGK